MQHVQNLDSNKITEVLKVLRSTFLNHSFLLSSIPLVFVVVEAKVIGALVPVTTISTAIDNFYHRLLAIHRMPTHRYVSTDHERWMRRGDHGACGG